MRRGRGYAVGSLGVKESAARNKRPEELRRVYFGKCISAWGSHPSIPPDKLGRTALTQEARKALTNLGHGSGTDGPATSLKLSILLEESNQGGDPGQAASPIVPGERRISARRRKAEIFYVLPCSFRTLGGQNGFEKVMFSHSQYERPVTAVSSSPTWSRRWLRGAPHVTMTR